MVSYVDKKCNLKELLQKDGLSEAERLTGKSYHNDKATQMLGLFLHMNNNIEKRECLKKANDTTFSMETEDYIDNIEGFGFKLLLKEEFPSSAKYSDINYGIDYIYIYYHYEYGILLKFDTYGGSRNGATIYYNWIPHVFEKYNRYPTHSGGWAKREDGTYIHEGSCDARTAIRFNIKQLLKEGKFLVKWYKPQFLQLNSYYDYKVEIKDYTEKETARRLSLLPQEVQDNLKGVEGE